MSAMLVEASAASIPVRRLDLALFARTVVEMERLLYPLPSWCEGVVAKTAHTRLRAAQLFLHGAGLMAVTTRRSGETRMGATEVGRQWLGLSMKGRLRSVIDHLGAATGTDQRIEYLPSPPGFLLLSGKLDLRQAIQGLFRDLGKGRYVEYRSFLRKHAQRGNPYLELRRQGVRMSVHGLEGYRDLTRAELTEQWERLVERFFAQRLLVLDAVSLGLTAERRLCFALTDVGRCLLGQSEDFEYAKEGEARIVLQPNFEVVFLSPNTQAEAAMSRYAERTGRDVGTLFRITKRSVLRAAAAGLDADEVLSSLREHTSGGVPGNVASEISGWMAACRLVALESALLIRLPDAETAARAQSAGGRYVRLISDTIVEVLEPRRRRALERRLAEEGIFLRHT
jgi:hypothetical protein